MTFERSQLRYAHTNGFTGLIYTDDGDIITCGTDGDIRFWKNIDDDDPTSHCLGEFVYCLLQKDKKLYASTDRNTVQAYTSEMDRVGVILRFTAPVTTMCIKDQYLAAGSEDTTIKIIKDLNTDNPIEITAHSGPILGLTISCKGILASIAGDGQLKVWNLTENIEIKSFSGFKKVNSFENASHYQTICFEPTKGNSLAYTKAHEIYIINTTTWDIQFTLSDEKVSADYTCCTYSDDGLFLAAGATSGQISVYDMMRRDTIKCEEPTNDCKHITCVAFNSKNNNEVGFCDSTGQLGTISRTKHSKASNGLNDGIYMDNDIENDPYNINFDGDDILQDGIDDDDNDDGISIEKLKRKTMEPVQHLIGSITGDSCDGKSETSKSAQQMHNNAEAGFINIKPFKQQQPFQPSATPIQLEHRYLVWNDVGIVTAHADNADGSIDVEFHDASVHHTLHIPNYGNHNLAGLSTSALALSAVGQTKITCITFAATGNKEWSAQMPDCESVELLTATSKIVGVVTSMNFLRLFTVMGTQREILSIPGPPVSLAAFENRLIVCYHSAPSSEKQQYLAALIVEIKNLDLRTQNIMLPLTAGRQLTWFGFTDVGSPVFVDSMGLVQLFSIKSNCWYPVCDTSTQSASISNKFFVISISEKQQIIRAVLCRSSSYPMTNPRPTMQELPLCTPICDADTEKSELEDKLMRVSKMNAVDDSDKIIKETAIKLFALACRNEAELRAKELIETIGCTELLTLAVKYSSKLGRLHLSDRLSELITQFEQKQQENSIFSGIPDISLTPYIPVNNTTTNATMPKLAPKAMEISHAKRVALKRFAITNNAPTTTNYLKKANESTISDATSLSSSLTDNDVNFGNTENSEILTPSSVNSQILADYAVSPVANTPVNPFAAKRKLSEVDAQSRGVLMGTERLKLAKK